MVLTSALSAKITGIKDADSNVIHTAVDFVNYVTEDNQDLNKAHALVGEFQRTS